MRTASETFNKLTLGIIVFLVLGFLTTLFLKFQPEASEDPIPKGDHYITYAEAAELFQNYQKADSFTIYDITKYNLDQVLEFLEYQKNAGGKYLVISPGVKDGFYQNVFSVQNEEGNTLTLLFEKGVPPCPPYCDPTVKKDWVKKFPSNERYNIGAEQW